MSVLLSDNEPAVGFPHPFRDTPFVPPALRRVRRVEAMEGWRVRVEFDDGAVRTLDLRPCLVGPVFAPLVADPVAFRAVRVQGGGIGWDCGADIDPNTLYYAGLEVEG